MSDKYVPVCVGEFEPGDFTCEGNPKSKEDYARKPCVWNKRCMSFKKYLLENNDEFDKYVTIIESNKRNLNGDKIYRGLPKKGYDNFVNWCDELIKKYSFDVEINDKVSKRKRPLKKARKASIKRARQKAKARKNYLDKLFEHFKIHFIENLEKYRFTPPRGVIRPGRFYVIDRRKVSKYLSIYFKKPGVLGIPIALIKLKPRTLTFDIELPFGVEDYSGVGVEIMKKIHPRKIDDGRFKSICVGMDKERVAILAQTIARMIKKGKIELL